MLDNTATLEQTRKVVTLLRQALRNAQRNHHTQAMWEAKFAEREGRRPFNVGHHGAHWQHCPAMSCSAAARVWDASKPFGTVDRAYNHKVINAN